MKTWCEHIKLLGDKYVIFNVNSIWEGIDFNFCPICGTPRPEPKKGLAEKLKDADMNSNQPFVPYTLMAKAAYEHFSEIVDEMASDKRVYYLSAEEINKRFKESL